MRAGAAFVLTLLGILHSGAAPAATLERLLMPGEVAKAHAKVEQECSKCHDRADKGRQSALCMDCHKDVAADVRARTGFHGRAVKPAVACSTCHTDHAGREADIVRFDRDAFDHARTDFALTGAHAGAACDACHVRGKKFREAPKECIDCHRKQDVHQGRLGNDCAACHSTENFTTTKFDHSKTKFPLQDAHARAACDSCHRTPDFKNTPLECVACHARDDVHQGGRGPNCGECHDSAQWKVRKFDHLRVARFALNGRHASIDCQACHRTGDMKAPVPKTCAGCHSADDRHGGRFGADCAACHGETDWKQARFDHARQAKFELRGAHAKLDCHSCHRANVKAVPTPKDCFGCHAPNDVHRGTMGKDCASCHDETSWRAVKQFDHDLTKFPLVGLHVNVACEECHVSRAYRGTPAACVACHAQDDVHKGGLGKECAACHNPNGWRYWQFDHGQATRFALEGAHAKVDCRGCHVQPASEVKLATDCASCHARDDIHDGRFGHDCARCHGSVTWRGAAPRR
jgi:hypothetical protein